MTTRFESHERARRQADGGTGHLLHGNPQTQVMWHKAAPDFYSDAASM